MSFLVEVSARHVHVSQEDLEKLFGTKVFLDLWVKVKENWRDSVATVSNFGYKND